MRVELMTWQVSWLERQNGIHWLLVQIPLTPTFCSYLTKSFSGEYHMYQFIPLHSCDYNQFGCEKHPNQWFHYSGIEQKNLWLLQDYSFIVNDGIGSNDLFKDGLHLRSLADGFIFNINSFLSLCINWSGQGT